MPREHTPIVSVYLSVCLSSCLYDCLSACLPVHLPVYLSVCLSVYLFDGAQPSQEPREHSPSFSVRWESGEKRNILHSCTIMPNISKFMYTTLDRERGVCRSPAAPCPGLPLFE